ncbi:MAG: MASE1 domain-containing protein [Elusimicrobia bacterium]|nr:MASE1 domain-containing protein [Elusimicrobiota bacterium]
MSTPVWLRPSREVVFLGLLTVLYFLAGKIGLALATVHPNATAVWPPSAIALVAFLLKGSGVWPAIWAGAFFVNWTTAGSWLTSAAIASGNTLEPWIGAVLVSRYAGGARVFESAGHILRYTVLAGAASTMISATLGVSSLTLGGFARWSDFRQIWFTWWLGDFTANLVIAPALLLWSLEPRVQWARDRITEALCLLSALGLVSWLVFSSLSNQALFFLCSPFLIWPALRFGPKETAASLLALTFLAVLGNIQGHATDPVLFSNERLLILQGFLSIAGVTHLSLAAVVAGERRTQELLLRSNEKLEYRVAQRTAALSETNEVLRNEIRDRRQTEEELSRKTEELSRSNMELERFASAASHDLMEPLRKIAAFGDLLERRVGIDEQGREMLGRMRTAADRMSQLIQNLLDYSRVLGDTRPMEAVDLNAVVSEVLSDLDSLVNRTGASISVGPLPAIQARQFQMRQLFQNLIANSLKFRRRDRAPVLIITGRVKPEGFAEITLTDNGIGFPQDDNERIFQPFVRLNARSDYEGTGLGLALCRRIMLRHGGWISAKGNPDQGSEFIVTLPVRTRHA